MLRINKILLFFLFFILLSFVVAWKIVQSEPFAKILSSSITKISKDKLNLDVEFEKLNFKFFPPGAELYNVKLKGGDNNFYFQLESLKIGISFDLLDSFETNLTVKRIYSHESRLIIKDKRKKVVSKNDQKN